MMEVSLDNLIMEVSSHNVQASMVYVGTGSCVHIRAVSSILEY